MANWLSSPLPIDEHPDEALTANITVPDNGSQDPEILAFTEARQRRVECLEQTEAKIEGLTLERGKLLREIAALDSLLGHETSLPSTDTEEEETVNHRQTARGPNLDFSVGDLDSPRRSPALMESVDATIEVLRRHARPLHYREIHRRVAGMGINVQGKDPAATLLSRFSRDPRIERVSSGTYQLTQDTVHAGDAPQ